MLFPDTKTLFVVMLVVLLVALYIILQLPYNKTTVIITTSKKEVRVSAEIADNPITQARGLMFRRELPEGQGMIFLFGNDAPRSFWMANTYIPLDLIFAAKNGTIVDIHENFEPGNLTSYKSKPAAYVLEVNAGFVKRHGITVRDKMKLG